MNSEGHGSDPRMASGGEAERAVAPVVARAPQSVPLFAILIGMGVAGVALFLVLDARRTSVEVPAVRARADERPSGYDGVPQLYVPPAPPPAIAAPVPAAVPASAPVPPAVVTPAPPAPQPVQVQRAAPVAEVQPPVQVPPRTSNEPALVFDATSGGGTNAAAATQDARAQSAQTRGGAISNGSSRARAGQFANRSSTIAQGTLIPAVLETGLDSTHGGLARAMVTQDVRGFDGSRILVPRGSRLIGEYASDVAQGQRRALIEWVRLIRPDGATIELGSPATDPVGRSGVKAEVNSHFLQRFEGAILQSALQVGVNLASRNRDPAVVLALPGATQAIGNAAGASLARDIPPTLKVAPGTSISVMVARDLEFGSAEGER